MNILTDTGYCSRFLTDWAGPDAMVNALAIRLGVPVYPGHTLTYTGTVTGVRARRRRGRRRGRARARSTTSASTSAARPMIGLPLGERTTCDARCAGRAAIAGIGQTEFSKESGRTELQLACEAVQAALDDAGLAAAPTSTGSSPSRWTRSEEMEVARNLGMREAVDVRARPLRRRRGRRRP